MFICGRGELTTTSEYSVTWVRVRVKVRVGVRVPVRVRVRVRVGVRVGVRVRVPVRVGVRPLVRKQATVYLPLLGQITTGQICTFKPVGKSWLMGQKEANKHRANKLFARCLFVPF